MSYSDAHNSKNLRASKQSHPASSINKSNVTLWKSKYNQQEEEKSGGIENEYIDNLKKQIYFMEMELKLMKEREREIEKTGGFTQLFNDDRDPSQHILQLKQKYATMRRNMDGNIDDLNKKRKDVIVQNVALKSRLENISNLTRDIYIKSTNLEEKSNQKLINLENDHLTKQRERLEIEAMNRLNDMELKNEIENNIQLDHTIQHNHKIEEMKQLDFEKQMSVIENMTQEKIKQYEEVNEKMKQMNSKFTEEPYFKIEFEKNEQYKKKIEEIEKEILDVNSKVEMLDITNEYLAKKKEEVVYERKKLINQNEDLKREIEAKMQLNEIRIQKKVKENNSEEIQKLEAHLQGVIENISELEKKITYEMEKTKIITSEILKLKIELKITEEKREAIIESVDTKMKDLRGFKDQLEELKRIHGDLKEKVAKETTDNQLFRNRNKVLLEEYSAIQSKYNFIISSSDYTSNLKKISMDDFRNLTQTNNLVNDSILNFVNKIASFKKNNLQSIFERDE